MGEFYVWGTDDKLIGTLTGDIQTVEIEPVRTVNYYDEMINNRIPIIADCSGLHSAVFNVTNVSVNELTKDLFPKKDIGKIRMHHNILIQKRRHHKTRINKKWAKRYGYHTVKEILDVDDMWPTNLDKEAIEWNMSGTLRYEK